MSNDWQDILQISQKDINLSFDNFYDSLTEILDKHAYNMHRKRMKNKDLKGKIKPWITHEVKVCMRKRNIAYGKYIRVIDPSNKS